MKSEQQQSKLRLEAAKRAAELTAAFGRKATKRQRADCQRAGQLVALAAAARSAALDGRAFDPADLVKLEELAVSAIAALRLPAQRQADNVVKIILVEGRFLTCPECGHTAPAPPPAKPPGPTKPRLVVSDEGVIPGLPPRYWRD